ncbi:hypothetical protein PM082_019903 [Marasmius tenuissimus]|nr:hypothetical protein PM082_019903 [Marasmius tenuissimus]
MSSANDTGILLEPYLTSYHVIVYPTLTLSLMTLVYATLSANLSSSTLSGKVQRRLQIIPVEMTSEL